MNFDCKSVHKIDDLSFICNGGFTKALFDPCCDKHSNMLIDFVLESLISKFRNDHKTNPLYLHLFKKVIDSTRQYNLIIKDDVQEKMVDIIFEVIMQRDDKISYNGIDTLEKYLRMHSCIETGSKDCEHLQAFQERITTDQSTRRKIRSAVMTCLLKFSKNWKLSQQEISEQYDALSSQTDRNHAVFLIVEVLEKSDEDAKDSHIPILNRVMSDSTSSMFVGVKERLLPRIFEKAALRTWFLNHFDQICENLDILSTLTISLLMLETNDNTELTWTGLISEKMLIQALLHSNDNIKITALRLLCFYKRPKTPIRVIDLKLIEAFLFTNMTTPLPTTRNAISTIFKRFASRIVGYVQFNCKNRTMDIELFDGIRTLLINIHNHSLDSLLCEANFNRRISSLTLLEILHTMDIFNVECSGTGNEEGLYKSFGLAEAVKDPRLFNALMRNLEFSYDLVQSMSLNLIEKVDLQIDEETKREFIHKVLTNADNINTAIQHRITFQAKVVGLKFPTELQTVLSEIAIRCRERIEGSSLNLITSNQPVHTLLNVVASLVPYIRFEDVALYIRENVINLCFEITKVVDPILQSFSPEGMLILDDFCGEQADKQVTELIHEQKLESQTLLVGCWRTLKCVTSIFVSIIELAPDSLLLGEWKDLLPTFKHYFWTQLTVCRHRGVFELAGRGFQTICDRYSKLFASNEKDSLNPLTWLHEIIIAIRGGVDSQLLCSTRRSAGLPYLVIAILRSYQPNTSNKFNTSSHFDDTLATLTDCQSLDPLFEIHCINVVKVLLHNTIFRKQVSKHLEPVLLLTFEGLNSGNWPTRNAYSQLFSVLVLRIFGNQSFNSIGKGITINEFSNSFPLAYEVMMSLLPRFDDSLESTEPIVQPVLVLFSHIRPSSVTSIARMDELLASVHEIAFNAKRESVRTLAIQSITSIVNADSLFEKYGLFYQALIQRIDSLGSNSFVSLLQLIGDIVERMQDKQNLDKLLSDFTVFLTPKMLSMNDFIVFQFLRTLNIAIDRGFSFDFSHLFSKQLPNSKFATSGHLLAKLFVNYVKSTQNSKSTQNARSIEFDGISNNFALHCFERILKNGDFLLELKDTLLDVLHTAKHEQNYSLLRQVLHLIENDKYGVLNELANDDNFCDWMTENELFMFKLKTTNTITVEQWNTIKEVTHDCTPDISLKILDFIEKINKNDSTNNSECMENQLALFLQDEDDTVRNKAALFLSPKLCPQMNEDLHFIACWILEVQRFPFLLQQVSELNEQTMEADIGLSSGTCDIPDDKQIFDALAKNTFSEGFLLDREQEAVNYLIQMLT